METITRYNDFCKSVLQQPEDLMITFINDN